MTNKKKAKAVKALIAKHEAQRNKDRSGNFSKKVFIPASSLMNRIKRRGR